MGGVAAYAWRRPDDDRLPVATLALPERLNPRDHSLVARIEGGSEPRGRRFESSRPDQISSFS